VTPLSDPEVQLLRESHPSLPSDYLDHLRQHGWGKALNGHMLYSGPIRPTEVYGERLADSKVLILGDDMSGYCFGFDTETLLFGEFSPGGVWEPWGEDQSFREYVTVLNG